ncbi:hypothetical protein BH23BAC2_BH23BAC2_01620 [soil metagenome]
MELLANPKTEYLLQASLTTLHVESQEWLKEIEFWRDELAFFYKLLREKESIEDFPKEALVAMQKELVRIDSEKLEVMKNQVHSHENSLAALLKTTSLQDEELYRETHRKLLIEIYEVQRLIRIYKKELFSFIYQYK